MIRPQNIAILTAFACIFSAANAQEQESNPYQKELLLEREYNPDILEATKIFTTPELTLPPVVKTDVEYVGFVIPYQPDRSLALLSSGEVNTALARSRKRGYLNLAGGNYLNFNGDAGYRILQNEKDRLSLWYSHRSTNGDIKYQHAPDAGIKQKAKLNDNTMGIDYAHTFKRAIWNLSGRYGSYGFNYYGQRAAIVDPALYDVSSMQRNQLIRFETGLASKEEYNGLHYDLRLGYYNFSRKYGAAKDDKGVKENSLNLDFDIFGVFDDNKRFGLDGHVDGFFYNLPSDNFFPFTGYKNYADICLNPYFGIRNDTWNLRLGALVHFDVGIGDFMASPDIRFDWEFARRTKLYINATGDVRHNSNYEMLAVNRYISPTERVEHSKDWLITEIGIRSQPATPFWFDINTGYGITEDDNFWQPYSLGGWLNVGKPIAMNAKKFHVGGALNYRIANNLTASAKAKWTSWKVSNDDLKIKWGATDLKPYGKPSFEAGAGMTYRPIRKLLLELDYSFIGGRYAMYDDIEINKLKNINELNLKGIYTFNDTFSLYAKANNLLFQKYELWWGYPMQGFNFQIGGNLNF